MSEAKPTSRCPGCEDVFSHPEGIESHVKTCVAYDQEQKRRMLSVESKVEKPSHYQSKAGFEAIDVIEAFDLDFRLGTAVKYLLRAGKKSEESLETDLNKALYYVRRHLKKNGLRDEVMQKEIAKAIEGRKQ